MAKRKSNPPKCRKLAASARRPKLKAATKRRRQRAAAKCRRDANKRSQRPAAKRRTTEAKRRTSHATAVKRAYARQRAAYPPVKSAVKYWEFEWARKPNGDYGGYNAVYAETEAEARTKMIAMGHKFGLKPNAGTLKVSKPGRDYWDGINKKQSGGGLLGNMFRR
jgi:hypothetical protein